MGRHRKNTSAPRKALDLLVDEVRASRSLAEADSSWGAVSSMHRVEFDIVKAAWEREEAEAEAKRTGAGSTPSMRADRRERDLPA